MTEEQREALIESIAQATCDAFDLKEHLRALYWDTKEELRASGDDYLKEQAEFYGLEES